MMAWQRSRCSSTIHSSRSPVLAHNCLSDVAWSQRGEPTVVHEHNLQADDLVKKLQKLAPKVFSFDGHAEEISSARGLEEAE